MSKKLVHRQSKNINAKFTGKMNSTKAFSLSLILLFFCSHSVFGQGEIIIGSEQEQYLRRQQLLGKLDTISSFMLRPIRLKESDTSIYKSFELFSGGRVTVLPFKIQNRYTDKHPYGWNDGSMLPLSGFQQLVSAGVAVKYGPLHVQFAPEYHYAENLDFEGFPLSAGDILWKRLYRSQLNFIDSPEKFGNEQFNQFYLGQSFAKLDLGPVSFGWSNQNLWWGPGKRNSLVMSNNARGFQHLTINSNKPIKTAIGSFEFQVLSGRLEASGFDPPNSFLTENGNFVYEGRIDDWRYLSGFTFNFQPKWVSGLSVGISRVVQQYYEQTKQSGDYFASFSNLFRKNDSFNDITRDQLAAMYLRYYSQNLRSEFYFEFSRNDAAFDFRDFFMEPNHSAGYVFGYSKLFPFNQKQNQFIELNAEWTILEQSASRIIRNASTFYIHSRVRHGYTNRGEILGAGIGPSSNLQSLAVNWVNGYNRLGLQFERYAHNEDLYIDLFYDIKHFLRPWTDVSVFANGSLKIDDFLFDGKFGFIRSFNYQYQLYEANGYFPAYKDVNNYTFDINISYLF